MQLSAKTEIDVNYTADVTYSKGDVESTIHVQQGQVAVSAQWLDMVMKDLGYVLTNENLATTPLTVGSSDNGITDPAS